jgi:hypothetical protein
VQRLVLLLLLLLLLLLVGHAVPCSELTRGCCLRL